MATIKEFVVVDPPDSAGVRELVRDRLGKSLLVLTLGTATEPTEEQMAGVQDITLRMQQINLFENHVMRVGGLITGAADPQDIGSSIVVTTASEDGAPATASLVVG
ncbi:MAG TPA: hypothetical protein VLF91_05385 [Candidatus Saccharimonadales bacterium]|nr:hypothetical protein [Candidatus Saccharimonadales bacterium]